MSKQLARRETATEATEATEATYAAAQTMTPVTEGGAVQGDGSAAALADIARVPTPTPSPSAAPHQWNDEFVGMGGSYVVVDGKRVPADSV